MAIETRSPDRTVTLKYSGDGTIDLELAPGCLATHTEASLAGQVRAVIRVAIATRGKGRRQAWRATLQDLGHDPDQPPEASLSSVDSPFARYLEANNRLAVSGLSDDGRVRIARDDTGEVTVEIAAGTLASSTERTLAAQIRSAMLAAIADHRRQDRELLRHLVGADIAEHIFGGRS